MNITNDTQEPLRSLALRPQEATDYMRPPLNLFKRSDLQRIRIGGAVLVLVKDLNNLLRRKREQAATAA